MNFGYQRLTSVPSELSAGIGDELDFVDTVYVDDVNGCARSGGGYRAMIEAVRPGDCIVVQNLSQLADSELELRLVLMDLEHHELKLTSIFDRLVAVSPTSIFPAFCAITNFKQRFTNQDPYPGLAQARRKGRRGGRKQVLTEDKKRVLDDLLLESSDLRAHAKALQVSERTVRRYANGEYAG